MSCWQQLLLLQPLLGKFSGKEIAEIPTKKAPIFAKKIWWGNERG